MRGKTLFASPALSFFLCNRVDRNKFFSDEECINNFIKLDDSDIWSALKVWCDSPDVILSTLSKGLVNRELFKVEVYYKPLTGERKHAIIENICN